MPALEAVRGLLVSGLVEIHCHNHLATALVRRHLGESLGAGVQHADASRSANLVTGESEEIAADRLHVHERMTGALRGIDERDDAKLAGALAQLSHGIHRAERVGNVRHREKLHVAREQRVELR